MKGQTQALIFIGFIFFVLGITRLFSKVEPVLSFNKDIKVSESHDQVPDQVPIQESAQVPDPWHGHSPQELQEPVETVKVPLREPIPTNLQEVITRNRKTLDKSPRWMDDDKVYKGSLFNYGLPDFARPWINLDVGENPIIPDLLGLLLVNLKPNKQISYLEIGVSVGKCLFQMLEILGKDSNVTALDLEEINPSFEETLQNKEEIDQWATKSIVKRKGNFRRYNKGTGRPILNYVSSDEFDQGGWEALVNNRIGPFDAIYSDALHSPDALKYEWKSIKERNLLAIRKDNFWFMAWDDLGPVMKQAAKEIMEDMKLVAKEKGEDHVETAFLMINGWLGKNEGPHSVGVVSNLQLHKILKEAGFELVEDK